MPDPGLQAARAVRLRELFAGAVVLAPSQRDAWLSAHTGDDSRLLEELRALLEADDRASGLFSVFSVRNGAAAPDTITRAGTAVGTLIGHYRLDAWLGAGGMGEVYRAWDVALDRPAAVKLIGTVAPVNARRLLAEVEASRQLQHPAIATFFDGGEERGTVYLAMELVDGITLRQRLAGGAMAPTEALTILTGVLEALAHAHAAGFLHRDIKPENVMVTAAGVPKLLDFGIARELSAVESSLSSDLPTRTAAGVAGTRTAGMVGTPGYMSPEQLRGEILTPASDVFQAGALLFEMLTGMAAFGSGSAMAKIAATLAGPPDLTQLAWIGPRGASDLVAKALAFDPADRFDSAAAFLRQVDGISDRRFRTAVPESLVVADFDPVPAEPINATTSVSTDPGGPGDWIGTALAEAIGRRFRRLGTLSIVDGARRAKAVTAARSPDGSPDFVAVGLRLGVRWMISGDYRRDGDRMHVRVRLIDVATGDEVRSSSFTGTVDEVMQCPDEMVFPIADLFTADIVQQDEAITAPPTRVVELYVTARQLWYIGNRDGHPRVFALLEQALAMSPQFVPALALLAAARSTSFIASGNPADLRAAVAAADRALALDSSCGEAWSWRGYALLRLQRVNEALQCFEEATRLGDDPMAAYLYGSTLMLGGRFDEALAHLQHAVTLEPRHGIGWLSLGWTLHSLLRENAARFALARARALEGQPGPTFVAGVGGYIAECARTTRELDFARVQAMEGLESIERSDHPYRDTIRAFCLCTLGRVALDQGDAGKAQAAFAQAVAQMRGRKSTLAGGHMFVQALAGLACATNDATSFREALSAFESRDVYSFHSFFGCSDDTTLFALAITAGRLGFNEEAEQLLARARVAGNRHPFVG